MCHARSTVHYTNCLGSALVASRNRGEIHTLLFWPLSPEVAQDQPTWRDLKFSVLWATVVITGTGAVGHSSSHLVWDVYILYKHLFCGGFNFFFSSRSLFFVSTGRSIIMIHAGWMIIFIWLDFLHGNVPSPFPQNPCMMYIHVQVCDNTRICILQFHPASKQELQVIWNFLCLMISCSNCYFFALALGWGCFINAIWAELPALKFSFKCGCC